VNLAFLTIVLAAGWVAATGDVGIPNLFFGAIVAAAGLFVIRDHVKGTRYVVRLLRMLSLAALFVYELFVSAFRVALLVLRPDMRSHLKPGIIAFPLTITRDAEITLLANMITLTPGTLSVDVSDDRKVLYVHAISVSDRDALVRDIAGGFEKKIIEAFR
jgi:multicomponent Na+:H+ antiporter subunit E